jgi:hypothetical protein
MRCAMAVRTGVDPEQLADAVRERVASTLRERLADEIRERVAEAARNAVSETRTQGGTNGHAQPHAS